MLASEIRSIFKDVITNYNDINIDNVCIQVIETLTSKGTGRYDVLRRNVMETMASLEGYLNPRLDTSAVVSFFEKSAYPRVLPREVLRRLDILLPASEALSGESSEANIVRQQIASARSDFATYINICDRFDQSDFSIPVDRILFSVKIRNSVISGNFSIFRDKVNLYERFFRDCGQYIMSSNDHVEIRHVAMSDLMFYLESGKEFFAAFLPVWKNVLDLAKEMVKLKSTMADLSKSGVKQDQIDIVRSTIEQSSLSKMSDSISRIAETLNKDTGRRAELKSSFEQTCQLVAADVADGSTLDLHTRVDITVNFLSSANEDFSAEVVSQLLLENQKLQEQITGLRKLEGQPLLAK